MAAEGTDPRVSKSQWSQALGRWRLGLSLLSLSACWAASGTHELTCFMYMQTCLLVEALLLQPAIMHPPLHHDLATCALSMPTTQHLTQGSLAHPQSDNSGSARTCCMRWKG